MNKKLKEFTEAYSSATDETKKFIDSDAIGLFTERILDNTSYLGIKQNIIVILANRFLAITTNEEILSELLANGINADTAIEIMPKIKSFIEQSLKNLHLPKSTFNKTLPDEIAETEAALKTLPTMTDTQVASRTEVYPSQQADILGAKNTTPSNSPRWGSES